MQNTHYDQGQSFCADKMGNMQSTVYAIFPVGKMESQLLWNIFRPFLCCTKWNTTKKKKKEKRGE